MNREPIANANDADLRLSQVAMERAAQRAYELAARTGTAIIISRDGVIERIEPPQQTPAVHETSAVYGIGT